MAEDNVTPEVDNATPESEEKVLDLQGEETIDVDSGETTEKVSSVEEAKNWYEQLDPDLKNNPSIQKFKDPASLAKSYVELQKMVGKDKVVLPTSKSTPEEWEAFYDKLGRPKDINEYSVPEIEVPEEVKMRPETLEAFKQKAHELGLTKKQVAELYAFQAELSQQAFTQQVEAAKGLKEKTETELRKEWGAAYETKVDRAQGLINHFFKGKELHQAFSVLANDRGFVQAMAEIAEGISEDVMAKTERNTMTPVEAQRELDSMMGDTKGPLFNDLHPEHQAAVDRYIELGRMAEAGK